MRDPNRIEPFMKELGKMWKTKCPDWRFGQLVFNITRDMQSHGIDIFYMEDDELIEYLEKWFDDQKEKEELEKEVLKYLMGDKEEDNERLHRRSTDEIRKYKSKWG